MERILLRSYLVGSRGVREVENLDVTLCGANNHKRVRDVERVASLWQLHR